MKHTIDAKGEKLGRVASRAASLLMGKNSPSFARNVVPDVVVEIINASQISLDAKKARDTKYARYSGFPGGLKFQNMNEIVAKKGYRDLFEKAIYGMLPTNKLRSIMIKNLIVTE